MSRVSTIFEVEGEAHVPWILNIPSEIVHLVAKYMPAESVTALAITCTGFYHALGRDSTNMNRESRCYFLELLERDLSSTHFCCLRCQTLHLYSRDLTSLDRVVPYLTLPTNSYVLRCWSSYGHMFNPNGSASNVYL